jgi:hypothetical protein
MSLRRKIKLRVKLRRKISNKRTTEHIFVMDV